MDFGKTKHISGLSTPQAGLQGREERRQRKNAELPERVGVWWGSLVLSPPSSPPQGPQLVPRASLSAERGLLQLWECLGPTPRRTSPCTPWPLTTPLPLSPQSTASSGPAATGTAVQASRWSSWCSRSSTATRPSRSRGPTIASALAAWVSGAPGGQVGMTGRGSRPGSGCSSPPWGWPGCPSRGEGSARRQHGTQDRLILVLPHGAGGTAHSGQGRTISRASAPSRSGGSRVGECTESGPRASSTRCKCPPGPTFLGVVSRRPRSLGSGPTRAFQGDQP